MILNRAMLLDNNDYSRARTAADRHQSHKCRENTSSHDSPNEKQISHPAT